MGKGRRGEPCSWVHSRLQELAATRLPFHTPGAHRQKAVAAFVCGLEEEESLQWPRGRADTQRRGELPPGSLLLPGRT